MRHIICYEGRELITNQYICPGAVQFPERPVPLMYGFDYRVENFAEYVSDFRREDDGSITVDVSTEFDPETFSVFFTADSMVQSEFKGVVFFANLKILSLSFVPLATFPRPKE